VQQTTHRMLGALPFKIEQMPHRMLGALLSMSLKICTHKD